MTHGRQALTAGCVLAVLAATAVAQGDPEPPVFAEVDGVPAGVWLQQPVELTVRIGFDAAWLSAASVPLFQQKLDQPFHVVVPWLLAADDRAVELLPPRAGARTQRIAVGDRVVDAAIAPQRMVGARTFDVLELRCRWLPLAAGTSVVAPVQVRYAFATRFDEDFLRGRQPRDRQDATVLSRVQQLVVRSLPQGAPPGFSGAVGEFTVTAQANVRAVTAGSTFPLAVVVAGDGNLDRFAPIQPPRLPGFHVQGVVDSRAAGARTFGLDVLALLAGAVEVPPVPFVAFSPRAGEYVTLWTPPVPLRVDAPPAGASLPPRVLELMDAAARSTQPRRLPHWSWYVAGLAVVVIGAAFVRTAVAVRSLRRQRRTLRERLAAALGGADPAAAAAAFDGALAAALGTAAWPGADGFTLLARRGAGEALVRELAAHRSSLDAARFGGAPPDAAAVLAAIDRLHGERGGSR